jgi:hypothetical protein
MMSKLTRQGDVLFVPVTGEHLQIDATDRDASGVIARGAHTHRIRPEDKDKATVILASNRANGWRKGPAILEVRDTVQIIHEEHAAVTLYPAENAMGQTCPAYYEIKRAREFDVMSLAPRMVID